MKTIKLKNTYKFFIETNETSHQINEWEDDKGEIHFSHGEIGHFADMVQIPKTNTSSNLIIPRAKNIFEAKARLIEQIVAGEEVPYVLSAWSDPKDFAVLLLNELGKPEDLPPLIGFFEEYTMKRALAEILEDK